MDLLELRSDIDKIDGEIVDLLIERAELSRRVAEYKKENSIPVFDEGREGEILRWVKEKSADKSEFCESVYKAVLDASKREQNKILSPLEK